jgi:hypothetical protein
MTEQSPESKLSEQSADNPMVKFLGPSIFGAIVVPLTWFAAESTPLQSDLTALATGRSAAKFANRAQHFQPVLERNAKVFEMLIGQVGENGPINVVLGEPLRVLGHAEFFEPICNLLHGGHQWSRHGLTEVTTAATESLHR